MCYPCTQCGRCGKYREDSIFYTPPATITCFQCGGEVDPATGTCSACGYVAFQPAGAGKARSSSQERSPQRGSEVGTHDHTA